MRIVKENPPTDIIKISDVDPEKHIIIVKHGGDWYFLKKRDWNERIYQLQCINDAFTLNNCCDFIKDFEDWINHPFEEAHAFNTFKEACQFLITVL